MAYRLAKRTTFAFLGVYFAMAVMLFVSSRHEVYPFYDWSLFRNNVYTEGMFITARFTAVDDRELSPPVFLGDRGAPFDDRAVLNPQRLLSRMREGVLMGDQEVVEEARRLFEAGITAPAVTYELVEVRFDTLERYQNGTFSDVLVRGSFTSREFERQRSL